jgi:hypothetical protein
MSCSIDTDDIEIESLEDETRERGKPVHNNGLPFSELILHGCELGELMHPIGVNTEGLEISISIESIALHPSAGMVAAGFVTTEPSPAQNVELGPGMLSTRSRNVVVGLWNARRLTTTPLTVAYMVPPPCAILV